ncbi:Protein dml1 [Exophiala dermatitidis]
MHEIVTIQLGQKSNYLATHFWNTQESYFTYSEHEEPLVDHDVHFRPGLGVGGVETFTPRTIIYDLKGGFGTLRKFNALYDNQHDSGEVVRGLWDGATSTQQEPAIEPTEYQKRLDLGLPTSQLQDSDVRYWSDFNRVFFHPRSIVHVNEYELNSQIMPFENWHAGSDLFDSLTREFDLLDRDIRPFTEECDHMQGFQVFTGADDAWGGFAAKYLEHLRDEYGKISMWTWGIEDASRVSRQKQLARDCNTVRSLSTISQQASVYVRLAAPPSSLPGYVRLQSSCDWVTTALLCTGLESITLPTRLTANGHKRGSLPLFEDTLNTNGHQNIFELQASITNATRHDHHQNTGASAGQSSGRSLSTEDNSGHGQPEPTDFDMNYSSHTTRSTTSQSSHVFAQVECERGHSNSASRPLTLDPEERLRRRLDEESVVERYQTGLQFPLLETFPDGLFETNRESRGGLDISAGLVCASGMKDQILHLRDATIRYCQLDERESLYNDLSQLSQYYQFGWDSGSDSGQDE